MHRPGTRYRRPENMPHTADVFYEEKPAIIKGPLTHTKVPVGDGTEYIKEYSGTRITYVCDPAKNTECKHRNFCYGLTKSPRACRKTIHAHYAMHFKEETND